MMSFRPILLIFSVLLLYFTISLGEELVINNERGIYQLDFDKTYTTYVNQDIEMMVSLPAGYKFLATIAGSRDFVSVGPIQNTVYISKAVPEDIMTNLTCHVLTPEGYEKKLIFKLIGKKGAPKVLAVQFVEGNTSELNRTVEMVKGKYSEELTFALASQQKTLNTNIHTEVVSNIRHWMFKKDRGDLSLEFKGASCFIDGMFNSRGSTFIQIRSPIIQDKCDVIKLLSVTHNKSTVNVEFVNHIQNNDGTYTYIYEVPEISFKYKKGSYKRVRIKLNLQIWSHPISIKFKVS